MEGQNRRTFEDCWVGALCCIVSRVECQSPAELIDDSLRVKSGGDETHQSHFPRRWRSWPSRVSPQCGWAGFPCCIFEARAIIQLAATQSSVLSSLLFHSWAIEHDDGFAGSGSEAKLRVWVICHLSVIVICLSLSFVL